MDAASLKRHFGAIFYLFWASLTLSQGFSFYPGASYRPSIPNLHKVVGHSWAEQITSPADIENYLHSLADVSNMVRLVKYGETFEKRPLYYLIIATPDRLDGISDIKSGMQKLADPRTITASESERLIDSLPVVSWLAYAVHGNEISGPDAAMLLAYHLVAAENDTLVQSILENSVVIIDPLQNPDGRNRFVNYYDQTRGPWPDASPFAAEHHEDWPGGRGNHYLFDMNRDWLGLTQMESQARVRAFLDWYPQVFVDFHEMGWNSTYYFPPPAPPLNPDVSLAEINWLDRFGRNNARWFDLMRFDYFTGEIFDSFYPGYGEGWPLFHGTIGMTYEQASTRGLVVQREDETYLHFREAVHHHFIASLATLQLAARQRKALLRFFYEHRRDAVAQGALGKVKEFIIPPGPNSERLVNLLLSHGIEVKQSQAPFQNNRVSNYDGAFMGKSEFPQGTAVVSMAQPARPLVNTLLSKHTPMDEKFIREQIRRQRNRLGAQIYDVTAWSMPLLMDVRIFIAESESRGVFEVMTQQQRKQGQVHGDRAHVAYLLPWGTPQAAQALGRLFQKNIRIHVANKPFRQKQRLFPPGTLIIKTRENPEDLFTTLQTISGDLGVDIYATNTSWVEEGINLGSNQVSYLAPPRIAMAYAAPVQSTSVGWTRFILEQSLSYPVTLIRTTQLPAIDLGKFNVLILPNGGDYSVVLGERGAHKIKSWIQNGGTLVTFDGATRWLTDDKVSLLSTKRELKGGIPETTTKTQSKDSSDKKVEARPFRYETAIQPHQELPPVTPGAVLRLQIDTDHWLTVGFDSDGFAMVTSRNIFTPLKLDKGRNVAVYDAADRLLVSGFTWEEAQAQLAQKAYLMYQPHEKGHVIAFAEDPNFRAICDGTTLFFYNAVFLSQKR